jgi:hypothetical protein
MPQWTGRITVTIDVDDYFEADNEREAEQYVEMNWTDYLYRASTESIEVDMEEDEEDDTSIQGIEE